MNERTLLRGYGLDPDTLVPITSADRAPHGRYGSDDLSRAPSDGPVGVGEYGREPSMGSPTPEGMATVASSETADLMDAHPGSRAESR